MRCADIGPQLSDYVDGTLDGAGRADVDAHLAGCAACAGIVQDFERLRAGARQLGPIDPPGHVWLEVAGRLHQESARPGRQPGPTKTGDRNHLWQWLGLAASLVLITSVAYLLRHWPAAGSPAPPAIVAVGGNPAASGSVETFEQELKQAEDHYDKAIAELEAIARNNNTAMDPAVAATLQKNLTTIDHAIAESRNALNVNPASEPARDSLFEALRQKVGVLQATVTLMNEMRKGNQDGAARVSAGLGRKS
jgi:anti-sigma factor RsiW